MLLPACSDEPPVAEPRVPAVIGRVVDFDARERVDGDFVGAIKLTLADGTIVDVPRGTRYDGPNCTFIDDTGQSEAYREGRTECAINAVMTDGEVTAVVGIPVGDVAQQARFGTLVQVNRQQSFIADRFGNAYRWQVEPFVNCDALGIVFLDDPALIDHGAVFPNFDDDGWLIGVTCGLEQ